jgi:hypothetical protein
LILRREQLGGVTAVKVTENSELRRIFGAKKGGVKGGLIK